MRTALDARDNLISFANETPNDESLAKARQAVTEALRELTQMRNWSYFQRLRRLVTSDDYSTGTVVYDHTGGTYERLLTLTTGTWPSWAAHGIVVISDVWYEVDERRSDSLITLKSDSNPGADVSSTSYAIYRQHYSLGSDFQSGSNFTIVSNNRDLEYLNPRDFQLLQSQSRTAGNPSRYTIVGEEDTSGGMAIHFWPYPDDDYNIDYLAYIFPRAITTWKYETGTITNTTSSTTITGNGTAFTSRMEGSILRISDSTEESPTGLDGAYPYDQEVTIKERVSATSLRVDTAVTSAHTAVKYVISDPIDIDENVMGNLFMRIAERKFGALRRLKGMDQLMANVEYEKRFAFDADSRDQGERRAGYVGKPRMRLANMPISS